MEYRLYMLMVVTLKVEVAQMRSGIKIISHGVGYVNSCQVQDASVNKLWSL